MHKYYQKMRKGYKKDCAKKEILCDCYKNLFVDEHNKLAEFRKGYYKMNKNASL